MITFGVYYLVEIDGDSMVVLSQHEKFYDALDASHVAEQRLPGATIGIAINGRTQLLLRNNIVILTRAFDGTVWVEAQTTLPYGVYQLGQFPGVASAMRAARAWEPTSVEVEEEAA